MNTLEWIKKMENYEAITFKLLYAVPDLSVSPKLRKQEKDEILKQLKSKVAFDIKILTFSESQNRLTSDERAFVLPGLTKANSYLSINPINTPHWLWENKLTHARSEFSFCLFDLKKNDEKSSRESVIAG